MAIVDVRRGLTELRRQLRGSGNSLRDYAGRTQLFIGGTKTNTNTPEQQASRQMLEGAGAGWRALDPTSKQAWKAYAAKYGKNFGDQKYKDISGWDVYQAAYRNRKLQGLEAAAVPVASAPPGRIASVEEIASSDARTFTFKIEHSVAVPAAVGSSTPGAQPFALLCRITPATVSIARKPTHISLRLIKGHSAQSLIPLPESGESVTFTNAQFAIELGERYGLELRIVRVADGVHSRAVFHDLYRKETGDGGEVVIEEKTEPVVKIDEASRTSGLSKVDVEAKEAPVSRKARQVSSVDGEREPSARGSRISPDVSREKRVLRNKKMKRTLSTWREMPTTKVRNICRADGPNRRRGGLPPDCSRLISQNRNASHKRQRSIFFYENGKIQMAQNKKCYVCYNKLCNIYRN